MNGRVGESVSEREVQIWVINYNEREDQTKQALGAIHSITEQGKNKPCKQDNRVPYQQREGRNQSELGWICAPRRSSTTSEDDDDGGGGGGG